MIDKIRALVRGKDTCVLATATGGKPHCSLMSYIADSDCRQIFMVTHRQTNKYKNLLENPWVSLLIDTREEDPHGEVGRKKALTVSGIFQNVDPGKKDSIRKKFLKKHPQLKELVDDPEAEIFAIQVQSFQLLEGFRDSYYAIPD
jgi:general stress protein 26